MIIYILYSFYNFLVTSIGLKEPEKEQEVAYEIERPFIDEADFYEKISELRLTAMSIMDIAITKQMQDSALNLIEICDHILQAEHVKDQSHIDFNGFYYEKIELHQKNAVDVHMQLMSKRIILNSMKSILS